MIALSKKNKIIIISIFSLTLFIILLFIPAIPQDQKYHLFADTRKFFGIVNFNDVVSNVLFNIVGLTGIILLLRNKLNTINQNEKWLILSIFACIFLVGIGSAYYHVNPNDSTLFWDRLPIALTFVLFTDFVISERISQKIAYGLLIPLVLFGIFSVIYWYFTEMNKNGDLRFYIFAQFAPILIIPLIASLFKSKYSNNFYLYSIIVSFIIAKIIEIYDHQIFSITGNLISGHTLKHFFAAYAGYWLIKLRIKKI